MFESPVKLIVTAAEAGQRLDAFVHGQFSHLSRARIQNWIKSGRVTVNGAGARPSHVVRTGELVAVEPAELEPLSAAPEDIPLSVLYEDDDLIAIDKPAGMVVHAGAGVHSGTLVNALLSRFEKLSGVGGDLRPGIVHRLDRFTSGVLLVAKTDAAHRNLAAQFAARETRKIYLAMVHRALKKPEGRIEKPIARDPSVRARMTTRVESGRNAITEYRLLEQFQQFSYLEVRILTGRTHQIRVHLASIGHPVAGDRLYGAPGCRGCRRTRPLLSACSPDHRGEAIHGRAAHGYVAACAGTGRVESDASELIRAYNGCKS